MEKIRKIIFLVGLPKSGKKTLAKQLCSEFGYQHISLPNSPAKNDNEEVKQLTDEQYVEQLHRELVEVKNSKCLVTGFPRNKAQAILFESTFREIQSIIELAVTEEVIAKRNGGEPLIEEKLNDYNNNVKPFLDYYRILGKVRTIDSSLTPTEVYKQFAKATLPEVFFVMGPKCSGKTTVCKNLSQRANLQYVDFKTFCKKTGESEAAMKEFIKELHKIPAAKIIVDDFPETSKQLLFFLANAIPPAKCFLLNTPEDSCINFSQNVNDINVPPSILCKSIKEFYLNLKDMLPVLKKIGCLIQLKNNESIPLNKLLEEAAGELYPEVILMRSDEEATETMNTCINDLCEKFQYRLLEPLKLCKEEAIRKTAIGKHLIELSKAGKFITTETLIQLLKKYLYPLDCHKKFVVKDFPEEINQVKLLEETCCHIYKEFYFYPEQGEKIIKSDQCTIETIMNKTNRLIVLDKFESENLERYYGDHLIYTMIIGAPLSGKTTAAKIIEKSGYTLLDAVTLAEDIKKRLATEDNPAESITVSLDQLIEEIKTRIVNRTSKREKFVIDGFTLEESIVFDKIVSLVGPPAFFIELTCDNSILKERYKKKNELTELSEDQVAELDKTFSTYEELLKTLELIKTSPFVQYFQINSEISETLTFKDLRTIFEPKLILITREASIATDVILQNLSIKYHLVFIPLAEVIKEEVLVESEIGKELKRTRKFRKTIDESPNWQFYPVHYESKLLIRLVKERIKRLRVNQKHVLIDGLLNCSKLKEDEDKLELRAIDELLAIEKEIGETKAIIRLTREDYEQVIDDRIAERLVAEEIKEEKKEEKKEEGEEEQIPAVEDEDKSDKPKFKPEEFAWTNTEGKPRNLGQFFSAWKKCATKSILFNEMQSQGAGTDIVLDSLLSSILAGQLSKQTIYVQVKFTT